MTLPGLVHLLASIAIIVAIGAILIWAISKFVKDGTVAYWLNIIVYVVCAVAIFDRLLGFIGPAYPQTYPSAPPPHVHPEGDWIRQGDYRTKEGNSCCGLNDCKPEEGPIPEAPMEQTFSSQDGRLWVCRHTSGEIKCVFAPRRLSQYGR